MHQIIQRWACVAVVAACTSSVAAQAPDPRFRPQVGRYQLVDSEGGVYLLDTATGQCWRRSINVGWHDAGNPTRERSRDAARGRDGQAAQPQLPSEAVEMTLVQRDERAIPGSNGSVWLRLGDITEGQVLLSVVDAQRHALLETTSVAQGERVEFTVAGSRYAIRIKELRNVLLGDDFATLVIEPADAVTGAAEADATADAEVAAQPKSSKAAAVQGRVVVDGQPLAKGRILFHSDADSLVGAKIKDGQYKIEAVPVGVYKVTVESENVAARYASEDQSALQVDVRGGANQFDFDLTSR